ncbi:MAG TPA: hypothetical protein VD996_02545 [Chitinophagaceae bacterium]|nr:hypothetical protein [Chitinophagaceae bacterium]
MENKLRKRLLNWHYYKSKTVSVVDLLESTYQSFRYRVGNRIGNSGISFRDAIKQANQDELEQLDNIILEDRIQKKQS